MKKVILRTLSAVLALASVFSIVSCGGGGKSENTIRYYIWGNEKDTMIVNKIIDGFEAVYPEYNVELEVSAGASASYFNNLQTYFGGGEAPDVFMIRGGVIESYIKNEMLLDLTPYIQAENGVFKESDLWELNDIYRSKGDGIMGEGNLYAVIKDWSPDFTMIYNKNLIEKYNPKYFLHGHVHMPYGREHKRYDKYKNTHVINGYERFIFDFEDEVLCLHKYGKTPLDPRPSDF